MTLYYIASCPNVMSQGACSIENQLLTALLNFGETLVWARCRQGLFLANLLRKEIFASMIQLASFPKTTEWGIILHEMILLLYFQLAD